jgi:hypothetical protein
MARYNVSFSCSECGRLHPTKIFLSRGEQFAARKPLAEVYKAEPLPPEVINLFRYPALCPVTRNSVILNYSDRLYLVASI